MKAISRGAVYTPITSPQAPCAMSGVQAAGMVVKFCPMILLSTMSSHDIATFPEKLKELDGVREVTIVKKRKDQNGDAA